MTPKPKESINCVYYVKHDNNVMTDPINPNNTIHKLQQLYSHTNPSNRSDDSVFNKQTILIVAPACSLQNRIQQ